MALQKGKVSLEVPGFEPGAFRMRSGHSTTELHPLDVEHLNLCFSKIQMYLSVQILGQVTIKYQNINIAE